MSARLDFKGDYMGFTYNGKHSSELGIVRASDGSRFNENLLPTIQDKTVQVPGGDGTYYFGSYYTQRQFSIDFAFDSLTEQQIALLKAHFGDKGVHDLIFDETPYKVWSAKATGTATIKYIPFDEGSTHRLYKGEGTIQFTCYYPFARCAFSDTATKESLRNDYPNIDEWWDAAHIEPGKNFGDVPVPFTLVLDPKAASTQINLGEINWEKLTEKSQLDTRTGLVFKLDASGNLTSTLMNKYVTGNLTVKIPVGAEAPSGAVFYCEYI